MNLTEEEWENRYYKMREISGEDEYSYFITGSFSDVEVDKDHDHHH